MRFATAQMKADRVAEGIDEGVDLGAQAAARAANGLVFARSFSRAGTVLMGAYDGAVDHRIFVVSVPGQALQWLHRLRGARHHRLLAPATRTAPAWLQCRLQRPSVACAT